MRFIRDDAIVPALEAPDKAYRIEDDRGRLLGVVAGHGSLWFAGRVGPSRVRPIIPCAVADTRQRAAYLMVAGRP